jgi:hypothetical protein
MAGTSALHRSTDALQAGIDRVRGSPRDEGVVRLIVRRPGPGQREVLDVGELDVRAGLVGDSWLTRGSGRTPDGSADPEAQVTVMNERAIALMAVEPDRWQLAGDQLFVDLDLGVANLPPGTRLRVGTALLEVSETPHTGCAQFSARFGPDALRFVSTPEGRALRLRGLNARVVRSGVVRTGDLITKVTEDIDGD